MGAHDVVAEEVEGAVEMIARLLRWVEVPRNMIDQRVSEVRAQTQTTERKQTVPRSTLREVHGLDELKIESALVREGSPAHGTSAVALRLRSETGALIVGVRRGDHLLESPDPHHAFEAGDVVYFVGTGEAVQKTLPLFDPGRSSSPRSPRWSGDPL
jgi:monovalent cation:H+ antiporter-2, CPA2 family